MYLNTTVKIPEIKGKIITKKKETTTYILYQYGSEYRPEKQYSVPLRTIVGKISSSDSTLMIPNEKFQSYFPDVKLPEVLPLAYRSCCLKIGSCIIIQKILNEYKLIPMLKKRFGVNGTTHVLVQNKLPDLISGSLVYCFRIPAGRSFDHGSSFSK